MDCNSNICNIKIDLKSSRWYINVVDIRACEYQCLLTGNGEKLVN